MSYNYEHTHIPTLPDHCPYRFSTIDDTVRCIDRDYRSPNAIVPMTTLSQNVCAHYTEQNDDDDDKPLHRYRQTITPLCISQLIC